MCRGPECNQEYLHWRRPQRGLAMSSLLMQRTAQEKHKKIQNKLNPPKIIQHHPSSSNINRWIYRQTCRFLAQEDERMRNSFFTKRAQKKPMVWSSQLLRTQRSAPAKSGCPRLGHLGVEVPAVSWWFWYWSWFWSCLLMFADVCWCLLMFVDACWCISLYLYRCFMMFYGYEFSHIKWQQSLLDISGWFFLSEEYRSDVGKSLPAGRNRNRMDVVRSTEVKAMAMPLPVQNPHRSWWTTPEWQLCRLTETSN